MPSSGLIRRLPAPPPEQGLETVPIGIGRWTAQLPPTTTGGYGTITFTASTTSFNLVPFRLRRPLPVDAVTVDVGTSAAGSTLTVAVYALDAQGGRAAYVATIDTTTTGERTSQTVGTLPAGLLGFAWQTSGGNPGVRATSGLNIDTVLPWEVNGGGFGPSKNWEAPLGLTISGTIGRPFRRADINNQMGQLQAPSAWFRIR